MFAMPSRLEYNQKKRMKAEQTSYPRSKVKVLLLENISDAAADELRADIKAQMQSRVRWTESVQGMSGDGIQTYIEVGSGTVLLGLIKRIDASAVGMALGNPADFAALEF